METDKHRSRVQEDMDRERRYKKQEDVKTKGQIGKEKVEGESFSWIKDGKNRLLQHNFALGELEILANQKNLMHLFGTIHTVEFI